jgi:putative PIN family toxin of toxin-antitoxin system
MAMRAVLDTNVLLSGLLWHGAPHTLLEHARSGTLILISSPALLAELTGIIRRPKFNAILARSNTSIDEIVSELRKLAEVVLAPPLAQPVCRDPDDDTVLALAVATQADLLVSGDQDLLSLRHYGESGVPEAGLRLR